MLMKVLVINPGATSTKISAFDEEKEVMRVSISHSAQELSKFAHIAEQMPYRKKLILDALRENGMKVSDFEELKIVIILIRVFFIQIYLLSFVHKILLVYEA